MADMVQNGEATRLLLAELKEALPEGAYEQWFKDMEVLRLSERLLILCVKTEIAQDVILNRYPSAVKEAALRLREVGQISSVIQAGTTYHILRLEKAIEPDKVKFADVKDALYKGLFELRVQEMQMKVLEDIILQADHEKKFVYVNPILAELNRQEKIAASQPAK